jgi:Calcium-activated BK potassium channel alpha subunit
MENQRYFSLQSSYNTNIHFYISTLNPEFSRFHAPYATAAVCPADLNLALLGLNCIVNGAATLITNMVQASIEPCSDFNYPWEEEYADGALQELHSIPCNPVFSGMSFRFLCGYFYFHHQTVLLGVRPFGTLKKIDESDILLNPIDYTLTGDEDLVVIAHSFGDLADISEIVRTGVFQILKLCFFFFH